MRFPIWSKLSLSSNDGYIHSQKKGDRKQIGKIGVSHEKGGRICGSSIPGTLSKSNLTHLVFCSPAFLCWGKNGIIICNTTEKLHFQAGAGDEEVGGVEVVLLVLLTCLLVLLVLLVVENTGIFTLQ